MEAVKDEVDKDILKTDSAAAWKGEAEGHVVSWTRPDRHIDA